VVVVGLRFVIRLEVDVSQPRERRGVGGHARQQDLEVLDRVPSLIGRVEQIGDLPNDLSTTRTTMITVKDTKRKSRCRRD